MDAQAELMLLKAGEDRAALEYGLPDAIFGFHAQQAHEKLFKAIIASQGVKYDRTHDLTALLDEISVLGLLPLPLHYPIEQLQPYAVVFRYDAVDPIPDDKRQRMRDAIDVLSEYAQRIVQQGGTPPP